MESAGLGDVARGLCVSADVLVVQVSRVASERDVSCREARRNMWGEEAWARGSFRFQKVVERVPGWLRLRSGLVWLGNWDGLGLKPSKVTSLFGARIKFEIFLLKNLSEFYVCYFRFCPCVKQSGNIS
jgi:hypothetical protein